MGITCLGTTEVLKPLGRERTWVTLGPALSGVPFVELSNISQLQRSLEQC